MIIVKEWFGKKGILARLYTCDGRLFVDYNNCKDTAELFMVDGKYVSDTCPKKYLSYANTSYMMFGI